MPYINRLKLAACLSVLFLFSALHSAGSMPDTLHLYFGIDQYQLTSQHKSEIKSLVDSLHDAQTITINGFCDYLGSKAYNQPLSEKRADEVKIFMLASASQLSIITSGKGQIPASGDKTNSGDPRNRRVDIIFSKPAVVKQEKAPTKIEIASARFEKKIDSLANLEVGKSLPLEELTFEPGRHILRYEARPLLKKLLKVITDNKTLVFEIRGHVCCEENSQDGIDIDQGTRNLSVNRAREIYYYFLENGIDKSRMTYSGVGASQPKVYPEVTAGDQQLNRRVEIVVLKK